MAKGTAFVTDLLNAIFTAGSVTNLLQNGTTPLTSLFISLHTADPSAGNQNTSEATYTSYARVSVSRNSNATTGWNVSGNNATNFGAITFPGCTGGSSNVTFVAIGQNTTGTGGEIYYAGALNAQLNISNGITPQFNALQLKASES